MVDITAILRALLRTLTIPFASPPGSPQIFIGPPPGCLGTRYSAALIFWPDGSQVGGIGSQPGIYFGQITAGIPFEDGLEMGYVVRDEAGGICGFIATTRWGASNDGTGVLSISQAELLAATGGAGVTLDSRTLTVDGPGGFNGVAAYTDWNQIFGFGATLNLQDASSSILVSGGLLDLQAAGQLTIHEDSTRLFSAPSISSTLVPRTLVDMAIVRCSAAVTLTTSSQLVTGATVDMNLPNNSVWEAHAVADFQWTVAGNTTAQCRLQIDGAVQTGEALLDDAGDTTQRATVAQQWAGSQDSGDIRTFRLAALKSANVGTVQIREDHTTLLVKVYA